MLSVGHSLSNETPSNSPILSVKGSATFTNSSVCRLRRNWSSDFDLEGTWILSFWFMPTDDTASSNTGVIDFGYIHSSDGTGQGIKITYIPNTGHMNLWTHDGTAAAGSIQTVRLSMVLNKWYFIHIRHQVTTNALDLRVNNQYTSLTAKAIENPSTDDYIHVGSNLTTRSPDYRMCNLIFDNLYANTQSLSYFKGGKPTMDSAKSRRFGGTAVQPIAFWPLDNASLLSDGTIKDVSQNRFNLSVETGSYASSSVRPEKYLADLGEHGETTYCLRFKSNPCAVSLNTPINFNNTAGWKKGKITSGSDHMICIWFQFLGGDRDGVVFHEIDSTETYQNKIWFDDQTLKVNYYSAIDGGTTFTSDTDINDTNQHSLVVTYTDTGNAIKVYIDNSEVASGTADVGAFYGGTSNNLNTKNPVIGNSNNLDNHFTGTLHNFAAFTGNASSDRNAFHNSGTSPGNLNALSNCKCWIPMNWSDAIAQRSNASEYSYTSYLMQTGKKLNDIITVNDQGDTVKTNGYINNVAKIHSHTDRAEFYTLNGGIVFNSFTE